MSIGATSNVSNVATQLQHLAEIRQQQTQLDLEVAESARRVRDQSVERSLEDLNKQAERVNDIKKAALQARKGSIDVWA